MRTARRTEQCPALQPGRSPRQPGHNGGLSCLIVVYPAQDATLCVVVEMHFRNDPSKWFPQLYTVQKSFRIKWSGMAQYYLVPHEPVRFLGLIRWRRGRPLYLLLHLFSYKALKAAINSLAGCVYGVVAFPNHPCL